MMHSSNLLLLLATGLQWSLSKADSNPVPAWKNVPRQVLNAASNLRQLAERDSAFHLTTSTALHYGGAAAHPSDDEAAVMKVELESKKPFLVLEDNEDLFEQVACQGPMMRLRFASGDVFEDSKDDLRSLVGSFVVSSHDGCNSEGAREVYQISDVLLSDTSRTASLQVASSSLNEAFPGFRMSLDTKQQAMDWVPRRTLLQKRQSDVLPANVSDLTPLPPVQNTTNTTTSTADLSHSLIDHQFLSHGLVTNNVPFTLTCKNCSTFGSVSFTRTEFNFSNFTSIVRSLTDGVDDNFQLFESGSLELEMHGFGAHVELESSLVQIFSDSFTVVPDVALFGFEVPEIGTLGLYLNVSLTTFFKVQGGLTFGYGFDVTVPDGSKVLVDFANISDSTSTGFTNTDFTALPFTANISEIDITANVALRPQIMVGFEFSEKVLGPKLEAKMEAGVFLNLPKLQAVIALAAEGVDATCAPEQGLSTQDQAFLNELGNLTHITPSAELDLGVQANLGITAGTHGRGLAFPKILLSTATTLPTACLAFDKDARTFGNAQSMFAAITSAAAASASQSAASASRASAGSGSAGGSARPTGGTGAAGMISPPLTGIFTARDASLLLGTVVSLMVAGGLLTVL